MRRARPAHTRRDAQQIASPADCGSGTATAEPHGRCDHVAEALFPEIIVALVDRAALVAIGAVALPEHRLAERVAPHRVIGDVDDSVAVVIAGHDDVALERGIEKLSHRKLVVGERYEIRRGIAVPKCPDHSTPSGD